MTTLRRILSVSALAIAASAFASATTITVTLTEFGTMATFQSGNPGTATAAQFDVVGTNAAIQAACPITDLCSALTFTQTAFSMDAVNLGTVVVSNGNAIVATAKSVSGVADTTITDPLGVFAPELIPTFGPVNIKVSANSTASRSGTGSDTETGTVNMVNGNFAYTGPSAGSGNVVTDLSTSIATLNSTYTGTGNVTFNLTLAGSVTSNLPTNVTISTNSEQINGTAAASNPSILEIQYTYTYNDISGIPEPVSMVLVGSGLLALAFARKRVQR